MPKDVHRQLRHAAWKGDVRLAKKALKRGADVEGMDADFFTPTLIAARWGQVKMLQLLVERHNASLLSRTREGDTAYGLAELYGHTNVAEWLARKGCSTAPNPMRSHAAGGEDERPVCEDGAGISSEEESRTIWVGGIPAHMAADATSATLTSMFEKFGELAAISTRQKPGELKSWAFVTYTERSAAQAALAAADTLVTPSDRRSAGVTLQVRPSQVSQQLFINEQKGSLGQLAKVWQRRTPPQEEINRIREEVRAKYNELRLQSERDAGSREVEAAPGLDTTSRSRECELAPDLPRTRSDVGATGTAVDGLLDQQSFPVRYSLGHGGARDYKLGVGTMGLALFDGPVPVFTWPFKVVVSARAVESKKGGIELRLEVNSGTKLRRLVFSTEYADELDTLIQQRLASLLASMSVGGMQDQAMPFSTVGPDEYLKVDGVSVPFEVASFGPRRFKLHSCRAIGAGTTGAFDETEVAGCALALRRQGKYDFSFVETIVKAQAAGAVACLVVNYCDEFVVPKDRWAAARIVIPVLTLPLTIGGGMLARHGAPQISFSFGTSGPDPALADGDGMVSAGTGLHLSDGEDDAAGVDTVEGEQDQYVSSSEEERPVSEDGPAIPSEEESRTIWVGGIPAHMAADATSATLTSMFEKFGELAAISTRQKPGELKSWAFVTYTERSAAQAALAAAVTCGGVTLQVRPSQVSRHLAENRLHGTQGALASVWQRQMEKEAEWMGSLLGGLNRDTHYQAAKEIIAQNLGLRNEELEDELEDQELEELLLASWDSAHDDGADFDSHDFVQGFSVGVKVGQSLPLPRKAGTGGLGLPPKSAAQHPTGILVPQPEPAPAPTHLEKLSQGRGVSADFMITSQGVTCDV